MKRNRTLFGLFALLAIISSCLDAAQVGFNTNGFVINTNTTGWGISSAGNCVAIDALNNIIVTGESTPGNNGIVARYTNQGILDASFNSGQTPGYSILTQAKILNGVTIDIQSNIIVVGATQHPWGIVARYTPAGLLDTTFGDGSGFVISSAGDTNASDYYAVATDSNNNIIVVGQTATGYALVARYTSLGGLDKTYFNAGEGGTPGYIICSAADTNAYAYNAVVIDRANNIVSAGGTHTSPVHAIVARYTPEGTLDTTYFNYPYGFIKSSSADTNALQWVDVTFDSQNNIIVSGLTAEGQGIVTRYTSSGSLDTTFNPQGAVPGCVISGIDDDTNASVWHSLISNNSIIMVAGESTDSYGIVARYTSSGLLDMTFNPNGTVPGSVNSGIDDGINVLEWNCLGINTQANIIVAGTNTNSTAGVIANYFINGTLNILANWNRPVYAQSNAFAGLPISLLG